MEITVGDKTISVDSDKVILEIGCGALKKYNNSIGVDQISYEGIDLVGPIEGIFPDIPSGSIDLIYSEHCFEHLADLSLIMGQIARVLKIGGSAVIIVPHFSNPLFYSDPTHRNYFGLYTMAYYCKSSIFLRSVPSYVKLPDLLLENVELVFKAPRPFYIQYCLRWMIGKIFNTCNYFKEFLNLIWHQLWDVTSWYIILERLRIWMSCSMAGRRESLSMLYLTGSGLFSSLAIWALISNRLLLLDYSVIRAFAGLLPIYTAGVVVSKLGLDQIIFNECSRPGPKNFVSARHLVLMAIFCLMYSFIFALKFGLVIRVALFLSIYADAVATIFSAKLNAVGEARVVAIGNFLNIPLFVLMIIAASVSRFNLDLALVIFVFALSSMIRCIYLLIFRPSLLHAEGILKIDIHKMAVGVLNYLMFKSDQLLFSAWLLWFPAKLEESLGVFLLYKTGDIFSSFFAHYIAVYFPGLRYRSSSSLSDLVSNGFKYGRKELVFWMALSFIAVFITAIAIKPAANGLHVFVGAIVAVQIIMSLPLNYKIYTMPEKFGWDILIYCYSVSVLFGIGVACFGCYYISWKSLLIAQFIQIVVFLIVVSGLGYLWPKKVTSSGQC